MEKRYQVFLSSTFLDLVAERRLIMDTLIGRKCFPVGMENFPSLTINSLSHIYNLIDESDFFLLILNGVYGSSRDENGRSFTHLEWLHAIGKKKPIIVLYREDWEKHTKIKEDPDDATAFSKFFKDVKERHDGAKPWTNETLAARVIEGIDQAINDHPEAVGWIRADSANISQPVNSKTANTATPQTVKVTVDLDDIIRQLRDKIKIDVNLVLDIPEEQICSNIQRTIETTWEEIFLSFAPTLSGGVEKEENDCMDLIKQNLERQITKDELRQHTPFTSVKHVFFTDQPNVNTIKLEFVSNKLMECTRKTPTKSYWQLTPTGEAYVTYHHNKKYHPTA